MDAAVEGVKHSSLIYSALPLNLSSLAHLASSVIFVPHHELPELLSWVPSACRIMSLICLTPVLLLSLLDVLGYLTFVLVLRPCGLTSTIRFKDPEPLTLSVASGPIDATGSPSSTNSGLLPSSSSTDSSSFSGGDSETSSAPSSPETTLHAALHDAPPSSFARLERRKSSSTSRGRRISSSASSINSTVDGKYLPSHSQSGSTSSSLSLFDDESITRNMSRNRAMSVGTDGPLFGEEGETTDGATTPGAEDSDGGEFVGIGSGREKRGVPSYLRLTEVRQRPVAATPSGGGGGE